MSQASDPAPLRRPTGETLGPKPPLPSPSLSHTRCFPVPARWAVSYENSCLQCCRQGPLETGAGLPAHRPHRHPLASASCAPSCTVRALLHRVRVSSRASDVVLDACSPPLRALRPINAHRLYGLSAIYFGAIAKAKRLKWHGCRHAQCSLKASDAEAMLPWQALPPCSQSRGLQIREHHIPSAKSRIGPSFLKFHSELLAAQMR